MQILATTESEKRLSVEQLQPGIFIRLEASWFEHPFLFSSIKIKKLEQIEALKKAGITEVIYIPEKSDSLPLPLTAPPGKASPPPKPATPAKEDPVLKLLWQIKKDRMEKLKENQENLRKCTQDYNDTVKNIPNIMEQIIGGSQEAVNASRTLIAKMAGKFINKGESFVHLMAIKETEESIYYHSLNAAVLALMIGAKAGFSPTEMRDLGLGVLLHDIGKSRIDNKVLKKIEPLTKAEQNLLRLHPQYGVEIAAKNNGFPKSAALVILQHHEQCDGSGYPQRHQRAKISKLARVANIVNVYDNLCNNVDHTKAMNPYQALAFMYSRCKKRLDPEFLTLFIRSLGVYPPGTVVELSNGIIALVVSVNPQNPMKPSLMLYDPDIPKNEAVAVEMEDLMDLTVEKSLRFEDLPGEVLDYFNYSGKANYFVEQVEGGDKSA